MTFVVLPVTMLFIQVNLKRIYIAVGKVLAQVHISISISINKNYDINNNICVYYLKINVFIVDFHQIKSRNQNRGFGFCVYNGIDRKDNTQEYVLNNCVSCCGICNYAKNNLPFNDFILWVRKVNENISCYNFL